MTRLPRLLPGLLLCFLWAASACGPGGAAPSPNAAPSTVEPAPAAAAARPAPAATSDAPLSPPVTVRVGHLGGTSDAGLFIAQDKGYFREQGLELELSSFQSAQVMVAPLAAGQLDVGAGALSAALVNAAARDVPIKVVADKGSLPPGFGFQGVVVRKDHMDSGRFRGCESFRGLRVAVTAPGVTQEPALDRALRDCGLDISAIELVPMSFPDMAAALRGRSIDAAIMIEPVLTTSLQEGFATLYKRSDEFYPDQQVAVLLYGPQFVASQRPAAQRFMVAYVKALRDHWDAFARGKNKAEIVEIMMRNTPVKDPALYERLVAPGLNPDGYTNLRSFSDDVEWWHSHGYLSAPVDASRLVDNQFVDYALDRLGSYVAR